MITKVNLTGDSGAVFSDCEAYRYVLWRKWGDGPKCLFIMLNPSTATEATLDPTVRRCMGFARDWGFGALVVCNIFALRSTDPAVLYRADDPIGPENDLHIVSEALKSDLVVVAWGNHGRHLGRSYQLAELLRWAGAQMCHLGLTGKGEPKHPLYLRKDVQPEILKAEDLISARKSLSRSK